MKIFGKLSEQYILECCTQIVFLNDSFWNTYSEIKLDVDPQRDDDASPMSTYRCMSRPTWMISALQHNSEYKSNSISNFLEKKIKFFGSHGVVLVKTFSLTYQLLM